MSDDTKKDGQRPLRNYLGFKDKLFAGVVTIPTVLLAGGTIGALRDSQQKVGLENKYLADHPLSDAALQTFSELNEKTHEQIKDNAIFKANGINFAMQELIVKTFYTNLAAELENFKRGNSFVDFNSLDESQAKEFAASLQRSMKYLAGKTAVEITQETGKEITAETVENTITVYNEAYKPLSDKRSGENSKWASGKERFLKEHSTNEPIVWGLGTAALAGLAAYFILTNILAQYKRRQSGDAVAR